MRAAVLTFFVIAGVVHPTDASSTNRPLVYASAACRCNRHSHVCQSCYGTPPGSGRRMHRYSPDYHCCWRQPYDYRRQFDYPWHQTTYAPWGCLGCPTEQAREEIVVPIPQGQIILDHQQHDP